MPASCWFSVSSMPRFGSVVAMELIHLQLDHVVVDDHREGVHRLVCGQRLRPPGLKVKQGAVTRALDRARILVKYALYERTVIVRAAILDCVNGSSTVEHADLQAVMLNQAH